MHDNGIVESACSTCSRCMSLHGEWGAHTHKPQPGISKNVRGRERKKQARAARNPADADEVTAQSVRTMNATSKLNVLIFKTSSHQSAEPVEVRESAPRMTPPSYWTAMIVVCGTAKVPQVRTPQHAVLSRIKPCSELNASPSDTGQHVRQSLHHRLTPHATPRLRELP